MLLFSARVALIFNWVSNIKISNGNIRMASNDTQNNTQRLKYMLLWTHEYPFKEMIFSRSGQEGFIESHCPHSNCYITDNKNFFGVGDLTKFDAILFNGRNLIYRTWDDLPQTRLPHQKYIFVCTEMKNTAYATEPICNPILDGFFHWTATFKPGSDIVLSNSSQNIFKQKKKAVAWFVSNCTSQTKEAEYANELKKTLKTYDQSLDVYGECGNIKCKNRSDGAECDDLVRNEYFFHLVFEDAAATDHLKTKMMNILENGNVPIVYGGANYSSTLPLGSYINASNYTSENLASFIVYLINNPITYYEFFRYVDNVQRPYPGDAYYCTLCAALNDATKMAQQKVYDNFRAWWDPNYEENCRWMKAYNTASRTTISYPNYLIG